MYSGPIRGGTRGGQAEFTWDSVRTDQHRENYLGHSVQAPTGRWQAGRDVNWYNKDKNDGKDAAEAEARAAEQRRAELLEVKAREEEEMNKRLGIKAGVLGSSGGPGAALLRGSRDLGSRIGSSSGTGANTAPLSAASKWGNAGPSTSTQRSAEDLDGLTREERSLAKKMAKEEVRKAKHDEKIRIRALRAERRRARDAERGGSGEGRGEREGHLRERSEEYYRAEKVRRAHGDDAEGGQSARERERRHSPQRYDQRHDHHRDRYRHSYRSSPEPHRSRRDDHVRSKGTRPAPPREDDIRERYTHQRHQGRRSTASRSPPPRPLARRS